MDLNLQPDQSLVLFDGECAVCDRGVMYIIDHDPAGRFLFAPIQSELGQDFMAEKLPSLAGQPIETMVLFDGTKVHTHSDAVLRIAGKIGGPARLAAVLLALPRALRDPLYAGFARRRLAWFGKLDQCRIPTPEIRARFLA
jgi:predicted DCC family thiol-disulfide oxidoreductase YuxK